MFTITGSTQREAISVLFRADMITVNSTRADGNVIPFFFFNNLPLFIRFLFFFNFNNRHSPNLSVYHLYYQKMSSKLLLKITGDQRFILKSFFLPLIFGQLSDWCLK